MDGTGREHRTGDQRRTDVTGPVPSANRYGLPMTDGGRGYLRFPHLCGDDLVFCCEDDLWLVSAGGGDATRLTAGVAEAGSPHLSPDGRLLAYTSAQDGRPDVFVLPLDGGPARRLTFQAARCSVTGWHPGTGEVVYASSAGQPPAFGQRLFAVSPEGGAPRLLPLGPASALSFGPGGAAVLGRNTADPARWKRYRGGTAGELWVDADGSGEFARLDAGEGNLASPCWVGDRVFYLSDADGVGNVYSCRPDGSDRTDHTAHRDFYARHLATDGRRLVYHCGAVLYVLDPGGESRALDVRLRTTRTQRDRRFVSASEHLQDATPAPDGTGVAITVRGKAFTLANWSGAVRGHGTPEGVRHRLLTWLPGGERLVAVVGDEDPDERLVLLSATGDTPPATLSTVDGLVTVLAVSPVGARIAYATQRQELHVVDVDDPTHPRLLDRSAHDRIEDLAWSPDGRWLAYSVADTPHTTAIAVADTVTGVTARVTDPVLHDSAPAFDPDGRYLYFVGQRDFTPVPDRVQFGLGFPLGSRPYLVTLRAEEPSPFVPEAKPLGAEPDKPDADKPADPPEPLAIDLAGITERVVAFPVPEGRYRRALGIHGKVLLLSDAPDADPDADAPGRVRLFDLATGKAEDHVRDVDDVTLCADGSALLVRAGHRLRMVRPDQAPEDGDGEPGRASGWLDLGRVRVPVRPDAEWRQMFREAWRMQRENFWDEGMSGVDWDAVYERYAPLVDLVSSRAELSDLIWELHGELGSSHAYESGGEYRPGPMWSQGFLGVDWAVADGRWTLGRVLTGDVWDEDAASPCRRPGVNLREGDAVVAVNGQPVGVGGPPELLVDQAGREVELLVEREGVPARRVSVRAIGDESAVRYRDWVVANRAYVAERSEGRAGYLHVPDMVDRGYAEFTRAFLREHDREALLVDVRFNTGGNVSWLLLEKLARRRFGAERGRWSGALPYPPEAPRGVLVALTNEHAGSDGDIFSHVFQHLGLGPLVGKRTWGGVLGIWPRHRLVDGTVTTQPEFVVEFDRVGRGLENHGVRPDVEVDPAPHEYAGGVDRQLERAVDVLLTRLADAGVAAPPAAGPARAAPRPESG